MEGGVGYRLKGIESVKVIVTRNLSIMLFDPI